MIDIHHWLIDAAVELAIPLRIVAAPNVGEIRNRKAHGLSAIDLAPYLSELLDGGMIETFRYSDRGEVRASLRSEEFIRLLAEDRWSQAEPYCYRLTARGGALWERWAKPQWSLYNRRCENDNLNAITAASELVARQLLELEEIVRGNCTIVRGSVRHRVLRGWRATYWKTLPKGHLIAFRTEPLPQPRWSPMAHPKTASWLDLRRFRRSRCSSAATIQPVRLARAEC